MNCGGHSNNNRVLLSNECVQSWVKGKTLLNTNYIDELWKFTDLFTYESYLHGLKIGFCGQLRIGALF
jgi:hypothetical protein